MKKEQTEAREVVSKIIDGELSALDLMRAYLDRIESQEAQLGAWAYFNREQVLQQAEVVDRHVLSKNANKANLLLAGLPVGIKDIFDTADMPTESGTVVDAGRQPKQDAAVVRAVRDAGAIIMGKTVTSELAVYTPGKTKNPYDLNRTPGGSSSGSAAAVAAKMVPLSIGTQTNGSVIRPASYCGVVGYKPTFGTISRDGVLKQAPTLDQVGVFAENVNDAGLLAGVLMTSTQNGKIIKSPLQEKILSAIQTKTDDSPRFAFTKSPVWEEAKVTTQDAFLDFIRMIGKDVAEINLPSLCDKSVVCHRAIMLYEMAYNYERFYLDHPEKISSMLLSMIDEGRKISQREYLESKALAKEIAVIVDHELGLFDAVFTPATPSEAPLGLESTGSPIFSTIWSLCGVPAISLPVLKGEGDMPLGMQLVSARKSDGRLLGAANWVERECY